MQSSQTREELEKDLQILKFQRDEASGNSQKAYGMGLKAEAKRFSELKDQYYQKMTEITNKLKVMNAQNRKDNEIYITEDMKIIITKEYEKIKEKNGNYQALKEMNDSYSSKMKSNFEESQNAWKLGLKREAKQYSDMGKAYKILVHFSNENLKTARKKENDKSKEMNHFELKEFLNGLSEIRMNEIMGESEDFREMAGFYAGEMKNSYEKSQQCWNEGKRDLAKEFSEKGLESKRNMEKFNMEAAKIALVKNNKDKSEEELDLHGLTVEEAELLIGEKVQHCMDKKSQILKVIVGNGLHSNEQGPKLRGLVMNYAEVLGLQCNVDEKNAGCLIITFQN